MAEKQLEAALDLMRRLPPAQLEQNLGFVLELVPDLTEDLLQTVDQPLKVAKCNQTGRDFLLCDYNRDGDSYRSPWSNEYEPALPDGAIPSQGLRDLEVQANELFAIYREQYYEGGVSSVYFWDTEEEGGFACCILIKKDAAAGARGVEKGSWDSIHVIEVDELGPSQAKYKLTTTIMLNMTTKSNTLDLSGSITRQAEMECKLDKINTHLVNIGNMIQEMENKLRGQLDTVYFAKTVEITSNLRDVTSADDRKRRDNLIGDLANAIANKRR